MDVIRHFSKEDLQIANKLMKRCSTSLIIKEMKIKKTMSYHLTPVQRAIIKKSTNSKYWRRSVEKGSLLYSLWECKLIQHLWKMVGRFLNKTTIWPSNPTPRHVTWGNQNWKRHMYLNFLAALSTINFIELKKNLNFLDVHWVDKKAVVHTHNGILLSHKREQFESVLMRWMDIEPYYRE